LKTASFDLETIADKASLKLLPDPEVKPHGNIKDPIKIEADIAQKLEKAKEEQTSKAGLNPATAKICCFGWAYKKDFSYEGVEYAEPEIISNHLILKDETPQAEKKLLSDAWEVLAEFDHYTTFNGYNFDVPVLLMRSAIHRVRPSVNI